MGRSDYFDILLSRELRLSSCLKSKVSLLFLRKRLWQCGDLCVFRIVAILGYLCYLGYL